MVYASSVIVPQRDIRQTFLFQVNSHGKMPNSKAPVATYADARGSLYAPVDFLCPLPLGL